MVTIGFSGLKRSLVVSTMLCGVISGCAERNRSRSRSSAVQSTSTLTFAAGISRCDSIIFSAIRACTPRTGRSAAGAPDPCAAASTCARVITSPSPCGTEARSTISSLASLRTGGPASGRLVRRLVSEGVLFRVPDEHDRRRNFLVINPKFEEPLIAHLSEQVRADGKKAAG